MEREHFVAFGQPMLEPAVRAAAEHGWTARPVRSERLVGAGIDGRTMELFREDAPCPVLLVEDLPQPFETGGRAARRPAFVYFSQPGGGISLLDSVISQPAVRELLVVLAIASRRVRLVLDREAVGAAG